MSVHEAVKQVLDEASEPLHYQQITRRMLDNDLWTTQGKTPEATVNAYLATDIKQHGSSSLFQRTAQRASYSLLELNTHLSMPTEPATT